MLALLPEYWSLPTGLEQHIETILYGAMGKIAEIGFDTNKVYG